MYNIPPKKGTGKIQWQMKVVSCYNIPPPNICNQCEKYWKPSLCFHLLGDERQGAKEKTNTAVKVWVQQLVCAVTNRPDLLGQSDLRQIMFHSSILTLSSVWRIIKIILEGFFMVQGSQANSLPERRARQMIHKAEQNIQVVSCSNNIMKTRKREGKKLKNIWQA